MKTISFPCRFSLEPLQSIRAKNLPKNPAKKRRFWCQRWADLAGLRRWPGSIGGDSPQEERELVEFKALREKAAGDEADGDF